MTLTTKQGAVGRRNGVEINSYRCMVADNRQLRLRMKSSGIWVADCLACEKSPLNGLIHAHGFYYISEALDSQVLQKELSENWGDIHQSPIVWVQDVYSAKGVIKYDVKHALKNYIGDGYSSMRLLKSESWLPAGCRQVEKLLVQWALSKRDFSEDETERPDLIDRSLEYVPHKWELMESMLYDWCLGKELVVEIRDKIYYIKGAVIVEGGVTYDG